MKTYWLTLFLILVLAGFGLSACEVSMIGSSDPNVSGVQARATLDFVHAVQTSTDQAQYAAEWQVTVQAAGTQDALKAAYVAAQSTSESVRAAAAATQTEQVWSATSAAASSQATSTADAIATEQSWSGTATQSVWNRQATADMASLQKLQTAQAAEAEGARLAVERQRMTNDVQAAAPWLILAIVVLLLVYLTWLWGKAEVLRRRVIARDPRGDAPLLILEDHGRQHVIDPDLFFGAIATIPRHDQAYAPVLITPDLQAQVKARDQAVDLANRGLPSPAASRRALPAVVPDQLDHPLANIRVVDPSEVKDWLPDVLPHIQQHSLEDKEMNDDRNRQ